MPGNFTLRAASFLYHHFFPLYRILYFRYKHKKDRYHMELLKELVKPGDCVLDIGANIGFYTTFFSGLCGDQGRVYSFEPDKINFRHLKDEAGDKPNVILVEKAVASSSGEMTLYTSNLLNVDHRTYEPENYNRKYSVEKTSVDEWISGKFKVDLIKMDVQGFEMEALKGMVKTIQSNPSIVIFTELWNYGLKRAGSSSAELYDYAVAHGFQVYRVRNQISRMSREEAASMADEYFTDENVLLSRNNIL